MFGPLEVREDGRAVPLGGAKQRALLAVLLLNANEVVSRDRLVDELWGESPPETAVASVQVYVSRLRKVLADGMLVTQAPGYVMRVDPDAVDVHRFERLVKERRYEDALALWRGPPLAEFSHEPFAQAEIARLEELRLAALEERIEADLARGRHAELVGELEQLIASNPLRERLRAQLMLALYRSGRQAEALEAYQAARRTLVDELGIEPGAPLQRLEKAILVHDPDLEGPHLPAAEGVPLSSAFVGRKPELDQLVAALGDAIAGRGRLFLVGGEPGIGKSRLAEELGVHARAQGARVLVGRCWEAGGAPAYWPWVQSLRAHVRESDPTTLRSQLGGGAAVLAQILPELRQQIPDLPDPAPVESEGARFRLFDATAEFLRNASERRPIVLVLDDLHAADAPSLLLLRFLARELGSTHVLLFCAYRDVDPVPGQPLTEMLTEVTREPVTRRLSLGGLREHDVAEYVELTASDIASPELVRALHEETEGNPLFLGEIVRLVAVEGVGSASLRLAIPQTVREVIGRRLGHLSDDCNRVLLFASVLGREFTLAALARMSDLRENELLDPLEEAVNARVVADVPGTAGRLRFAHILIRDTLYEGIPALRRVGLHRRVTEALEALYGGDSGPHMAELAHHALAGNDVDRALLYARRAGDRAFALVAYEEAARLYETALDALDLVHPSDDETRCELLLSLGAAEARAGNTAAADEPLLAAAEIARRLGLARELARAAVEYGGRMVWTRDSDVPGLVPLLEEALARLGAEDVELRARLLARLAGALRDEPSRERRDQLSGEAVELARRSGNPAALVDALDGRSMAILAPDTLAECMAAADELREVAERIGDKERLVDGYMQGIGARVIVGDIAAIKAALDAATPFAEQIGQPAHLWDICGTRAMLALAAGRFGEGEELIEQAFALGERAVPGAIPVYRLQRYTLLDFRGGLDELEPSIRELVDAYPTRPVFRCLVAHLDARLGRTMEARRALEELGVEGFSDLPFDQEWLFAMSLLAETVARVGDAEAASFLYELLVPWTALNVADMAEGIRGSVAGYLGLLAAAQSRSDEAERHFEDALVANERMGLRPWLAFTQADYARMLVARARPDDRGRAEELLRAAIATYGELGMAPHVAEATALSEAVISSPHAP